MFITVQVRTVFGNDLVYPADATSLIFTRLTGRVTLRATDIKLAKELGFDVRVTSGQLPAGF